jgi:TRAP-type mannitol/chloroaromatic compound transport system substrate-binding protein
MGGWFAKEIRTVDDLKGVRMRISGFLGRVIARLGVTPVGMSIGQIIPAFEAKQIDAAEVVVPALDMALPLEKFAPHQYETWHEPDAVMHLFLSKKKFDALPEDLKWIVRQSGHGAALRSIARGLDRNAVALGQIEARGSVLRPWPPEVLKALQQATEQEVEAITDPDSKQVVASLLAYKKKIGLYSKRTIGAVYNAR